MKAVVQRVDWAKVVVEPDYEAKINRGLLVLLGIEKGDGEEQLRWTANKVANLRIFTDDNGKMNLSVKDVGGEILVVSQFTLSGDCRKGYRPSFTSAAPPEVAEPYYEKFCNLLSEHGVVEVKRGVFGAHMDVVLHNDGPVTIIIEKHPPA